jgi:hypothetical protein
MPAHALKSVFDQGLKNAWRRYLVDATWAHPNSNLRDSYSAADAGADAALCAHPLIFCRILLQVCEVI